MATKTIDKQELQLRILRNIANGSRTARELKAAMRKDVRVHVQQLIKSGSVRKATPADAGKDVGDFILTRKGAGQLRFAS